MARTNVAPSGEAGTETELHAFSYIVARNTQSQLGDPSRPSFVIAGAGDLLDQTDLRPKSPTMGG